MSRHNADTFVFVKGIQRSEALCSIYKYSSDKFPLSLDCTDLLRSAIVMGISSLDLLMHSICKKEIIHRFQNRIPINRLVIPFNLFMTSQSEMINCLEDHVSVTNGYKSFVAPDKISEMLCHFVEAPWAKVSTELNMPENDVKHRLKEIVKWRNRIAHEQDINPQYGGIEYWPILEEDVRDSLKFIQNLGCGISKVVACSA